VALKKNTSFWNRPIFTVTKDLNGTLELHVKFEVFQLKASKENVNEQEVFSVIEELGNDLIKNDTDDLLKQLNVNVDGKDRSKIGGDITIQVKYIDNWMMKVQSKSSLEGWKVKLMEMIMGLQRTHDKVRLGEESNYIPVYDDKIFRDGFDD